MRRTFLKVLGAIAAMLPVAAIGKGKVAADELQMNWTVPLQVVESDEIHINKLFRSVYDTDIELDRWRQQQFVAGAVFRSMDSFNRIVEFGDVIRFEVNTGRKRAVYDEAQGHVPLPPYYLWCRCEIVVKKKSIKNLALLAETERDQRGLLKATWI